MSLLAIVAACCVKLGMAFGFVNLIRVVYLVSTGLAIMTITVSGGRGSLLGALVRNDDGSMPFSVPEWQEALLTLLVVFLGNGFIATIGLAFLEMLLGVSSTASIRTLEWAGVVLVGVSTASVAMLIAAMEIPDMSSAPDPGRGLAEFIVGLVTGISLFAWAVIGFLVWVPLLIRSSTVFAAVSAASAFRPTSRRGSPEETARTTLEFASTFYLAGFGKILNSVRSSGGSGAEAEAALPWQRIVVECLWAGLTWGVLALIGGMTRLIPSWIKLLQWS